MKYNKIGVLRCYPLASLESTLLFRSDKSTRPQRTQEHPRTSHVFKITKWPIIRGCTSSPHIDHIHAASTRMPRSNPQTEKGCQKSQLATMKLHQALLLLATATTASASITAASPHRVEYSSLYSSSSSLASSTNLAEPLAQNGLVSITGISGFRQTKRKLMSHLHACMMDMENDESNKDVDSGSAAASALKTMKTVLRDGTIRRSIATSSAQQGMNGLPNTSSCQQFQAQVDKFRTTVDDATMAFANRLSAELDPSMKLADGSDNNAPIMASKDGRIKYETISNIVEGGEQLEHFHSYQKNTPQDGNDGGDGERNLLRGDSADDNNTISLHTDQGFFIAFTPGMMVSPNDSNEMGVEKHQFSMSSGFYVEDKEGRRSLLEFGEEDDLVFMLGDGVNQYINDRLLPHGRSLHATPHALKIAPQAMNDDPSSARVWYGRMILPPQNAYNAKVGATYGDIRRLSISAETSRSSMPQDVDAGIGCSSPSTMKTILQDATPRMLAEDGGHSSNNQCAENELFCWFRCMALDIEDPELVHPDVCAERNLKLQCTSPRDQVVVDGKAHGDYYPGCTNSTEEPTAYPLIDQADNTTCPDLWEKFYTMEGDDASSGATTTSYEHVIDISNPMGDAAYLMYNILENGSIQARLAYNNIFGWIAMGFANELDTIHNGMNGGNVIMAIPGGNYSPVTGLDLDEPASIATYTVDDTETAFRHWQVPTNDAASVMAEFETTDCFTAIRFESDSINGRKFNLDGTDEMIWAANSADHYVGYHGPFNRRRFTIDWKNGMIVEKISAIEDEIVVVVEDDSKEFDDENGDEDEEVATIAEEGNSANMSAAVPAMAVVLALVVALFL